MITIMFTIIIIIIFVIYYLFDFSCVNLSLIFRLLYYLPRPLLFIYNMLRFFIFRKFEIIEFNVSMSKYIQYIS